MQPINKAVILLAGYGTRCLPFTKRLPKAMIPILNKPSIHYIIDELEKTSINEIIFVIPKDCNGKIIKEYFQPNKSYEKYLKSRNKNKELEELTSIKTNLKTTFVVTSKANGSGGAVLSAKKHLKKENFLVLNGDDLFFNKGMPLNDLIKNYNKTGLSSIIVKKVAPELVSSYGIVEGKKKDGYISVEKMVEKPKANETTSSLATIGRYLLTNEILNVLEAKVENKNGEILLTDGLIYLANQGKLNAVETKAVRFDGGNTIEILKANIYMALENPKYKDNLKEFLKNLKD